MAILCLGLGIFESGHWSLVNPFERIVDLCRLRNKAEISAGSAKLPALLPVEEGR